MKKILLIVGVFVLSSQLFAQTKNLQANTPLARKCGTMIAIENSRKQHPEEYEALKKRAEAFAKSNPMARTSTLTGTVTIPVVVHVVHTTPDLVTEEQVDYLLNRLNLDYSGLNSDSANATSFYSVRGHSLLRFTRARRDPNGNLTNGIEKKVNTTGVGIMATTYQPVKHLSAGGFDPWDVTKYYNIWVTSDASGQGILGIAPSIGPGNATETASSTVGIDGVVINISAFSNGCYSDVSFNLARTAVHEIGHNFGLYHTFSGCTTGADFDQLDSGQFLPTNLLAAADDTPNQNTETSGCPSGITASDCSGVTSKMYQNYMDYSNDPCLTMFSMGQVARMEYVLENFRPGYLTTNGATPPSSAASLDAAATAIVSPGGYEFSNSTCTVTSYPTPSCAGTFTPKLQIRNQGSTTLTSVTVAITVNGTTTTQIFTGLNVVTWGITTLTFSNKTLVTGTNTISYTVSAPNGGADQVSTNNTISQTINIAAAATAPVSEGFESGTFPPTNWTLVASNDGSNWARTSLASKTGFASIKADFYNIADGQEFSLNSTPIVLAYNQSATLSFDYAYRMYNTTSVYDTLDVMLSTNCGNTWTSIWKKGGLDLRTVTTNSTSTFTPTAAQWATTPASVSLTPYLNQTIQLKLRARSGYGNNLYVDNVAVTGTSNLPLTLVSFKGSITNAQNVLLDWKTVNEINCQSFIVLKSVDGVNFEELGSRTALNQAENNYSFVDNKLNSDKQYYKLKMIEKDGKITYSNIIIINFKSASINVVSIFPNPVKDRLTVNINAVKAQQASVKIVDALGRVVIDNKVDLVKGNQSITLNTSQMQTGVYSVLINFEGELITQKLVKQ